MTNIKIHKKSIGSSQNFPSIYLKWNISSIPLIMGGGVIEMLISTFYQ